MQLNDDDYTNVTNSWNWVILNITTYNLKEFRVMTVSDAAMPIIQDIINNQDIIRFSINKSIKVNYFIDFV